MWRAKLPKRPAPDRAESGGIRMTVNVGIVDRVLRIIIGLALVAWAAGLPQIGVVPSPWSWVVGIVGAVLALTGVVGSCPAYALLGVSTFGKRA
jgi:Protein of unknown function (DUF2892)